jgi:hypothetical protein
LSSEGVSPRARDRDILERAVRSISEQAAKTSDLIDEPIAGSRPAGSSSHRNGRAVCQTRQSPRTAEDVPGIVVSLAERWKLQPKIALGDLHPDVGLQWSPDGRFLAFTAMIDGEHGLWVYSIEDDTVRGTLAEGIALAAWSPDGMLIASLMFRGEGINAPADVWVIDASELVGGTA